MLAEASDLEEVDREYKEILTDEILREIVDLIPDDWLHWRDKEETQQDIRDIYFQFLTERIRHSELFVKEAQDARKALI